MACCCVRISKCKSDIGNISSVMSSLQLIKNSNSAINAELFELSGKIWEMATPDNIDQCVSSLRDLNKGSASEIDIMIGKCERKVSEIKAMKKRLEQEDLIYHQTII